MEIKVNGITLYYEIIGKGKPLVFLHGNGEDHHTFDALTESLKSSYTCYLVDSRNHGKSMKDCPLHYEDMAEDIFQFIQNLKIDKPALFGFSDGAIIGMLIASKHPGLFSKLILAGGSLNPQGVKIGFYRHMKRAFEKNHHPMIELMLNEPQITEDELSKIDCPTLVIAGAYDLIKRQHTYQIKRQIKNAKLIIIPGHTHESYIMHTDYLKEIIQSFV